MHSYPEIRTKVNFSEIKRIIRNMFVGILLELAETRRSPRLRRLLTLTEVDSVFHRLPSGSLGFWTLSFVRNSK
jgi:hypothetical protein